jgi:O-antigen/teichoic acid export membrane protein
LTEQRSSPATPVEAVSTPGAPAPRGSIFRATLWTLGGEALSHPLRVISSLILTRLLFPDAFGLMALVQGFLMGLRMFSDLGTWTIIIRHERGEDPRFLNTVWTVSIARGFLLGLAACAISWPLSRFYGAPELALLLPAASLNVILDGFLSTKVFLSERRLARGRLTLINFASSVIGIALMVFLAWKFRSVWALVWGGVSGTGVRVFLSHAVMSGPPNRIEWDRSAWREVVHFGKWIVLNSAVTFLAMQLDKLMFAKMIPLRDLGIYAIATNVLQLPTTAVIALASGVAFPAFSRVKDRVSELAEIFGRMRLLLLMAGGAAISFLILNGPWMMALLYDPRYEKAGWILQVASAGGWFIVLEAAQGIMLLTLGHPRWLMLASATKVLAMVILVPLGFRLYGFPGALAALSLTEAFRYFVESSRVRREGMADRRYEGTTTALVLLCGAAAVLIQYSPWAPAGALKGLLSFATFLVVWLPAGLWYAGRVRRTA